MERWVLFSFIVVCVFCIVQAFPQADLGIQTTPASKIETAFNDVVESLQKGLKDIMEDPNIAKLVTDGQKALENAAVAIQTEAAKIIPKTEK